MAKRINAIKFIIIFCLLCSISDAKPKSCDLFLAINQKLFVGGQLGPNHDFNHQLPNFVTYGFSTYNPNNFRISLDQKKLVCLSNPDFRGKQRASNWCWAASIQMLLNYKGVMIAQEDIVEMVFNQRVNLPLDDYSIISLIKSFIKKINNQQYVRLNAQRIDPRNSSLFLKALKVFDTPIITGLKDTPTDAQGHAYLLTGIEFSINQRTGSLIIHRVELIDPWPSNPTSVVMSWLDFLNKHMFSIYVEL